MKYVSCYLVIAMFVMGIVPRVYAGFSPSEVVALSQSDRCADLEKIQKILEMKLIRERLDKLGFSQDEIQSRLTQLSDQQIHQLALQLDELKVGGNSAMQAAADELGLYIFAIIVIIALIVGFIVWVIIEAVKTSQEE